MAQRQGIKGEGSTGNQTEPWNPGNAPSLNTKLAQPETVQPPEQNPQQCRRQHGAFENEIRGAMATGATDTGAAVPVRHAPGYMALHYRYGKGEVNCQQGNQRRCKRQPPKWQRSMPHSVAPETFSLT